MRTFLSIFATIAIILGAAAPAAAQLPSVQVKDLSGKTVDTATLSNDGNPFLISFFATWCKPCMREFKAIHELYPDWQDETGVKMYIVSIDEAQNTHKVKPLVDSEGWDYEVLLDANGDFYRSLESRVCPICLFLTAKARLWNHTQATLTVPNTTSSRKSVRSRQQNKHYLTPPRRR